MPIPCRAPEDSCVIPTKPLPNPPQNPARRSHGASDYGAAPLLAPANSTSHIRQRKHPTSLAADALHGQPFPTARRHTCLQPNGKLPLRQPHNRQSDTEQSLRHPVADKLPRLEDQHPRRRLSSDTRTPDPPPLFLPRTQLTHTPQPRRRQRQRQSARQPHQLYV